MPTRHPKPEGIAEAPRRKSSTRGVRKAIDALIALTNEGFTTVNDFSDYNHEIGLKENDRGAAILLGTNLENALQSAIERAIRLDHTRRGDLFGFDRPLGSFAAKIRIAHALHIFGEETRNNLELIRNMRNAFAHARLAISFETTQILIACNLLSIPITLSSLGLLEPYPLEAPQYLKGRSKYETVCLHLSHNFVRWMADGALSIPASSVTNPPPPDYEVWAIQPPLP
jgi:hypothetical protein